jgi:putative hydrolase of the HAD superfamily
MAEIRLITFDLDNTLWNVESVLRTAEARMRVWLDEQVPDFQVRVPQEVVMTLRDALLEESPQLRHDLSSLREQILYRAMLQCDFSRHDARALARSAFEIFLDARHEVEYFEGALETLERLSGDYVLGALTNGNADISRLAVQRFFHFGYSSAMVGVGKPDPAMFRAALDHAGAAAAEAVHVGDHLHDDIAGAAAVGMHTIWINPDRTIEPDQGISPSHTVHTIVDVPDGIIQIARSLPGPT